MWTIRDLSLYGKITIIKTFGISQLVFPLTNLPAPPKETTKRIEQKNFAFLWDHKPDKIKRIIMYKSYEEGGLRMTNIHCFESSLKLSWVKRLISPNSASWKFLVFYQFLVLYYLKATFFKCNLSETDFSEYFCDARVNLLWK